jgi:5-methylcytosine-specific restriction endonuclease McrA
MDCAKSDPAFWEKVKKTRKERYGRNWEWEGWKEKRVDPKIWVPLAKKIREQDGHQCQSCDREKEQGENNFPVHHILPRGQGGPDEEWNLMTLCPSCHPTTDAQKNAVKYPHEYQSKLSYFDEPEEESKPPPTKKSKS